MAQQGSERAAANMNPAGFATAQAERFGRIQTDLLTEVQEISRHWMERAQTEATLAAEFFSKVTATKSVPEAMSLCHDWAGQRMKLAAEDASYALEASRKLAEVSTGLLPGETTFLSS